VRPEVLAFAAAMETELIENSHKGGWDGCEPGWLLRRLGQEVGELRRALRAYRRAKDTAERKGIYDAPLTKERDALRSEAADVGNFAMMIVDVCDALRPAAPADGRKGEP
jgi:NTP pyrophosphatase (non-canonical NTP hydrolase)